MEEFAVAGIRRYLAVLHLEDADILGIGLPIQIVLIHTCSHAFHIAFTPGDIKGIAEQDPFYGLFGAHLDIDAVFATQQIKQPFFLGNNCFCFGSFNRC